METTLNLPAEYADVFRRDVLSELQFEHERFDSHPTDRSFYGPVDAHRAVLDQIGWEDDGRDVSVAADSDYLRARLEGAMATLSDYLATAVGEYRKDNPVESEDVRRFANGLLWLVEATECLDARVAEAVAA